MDEKSTNDVKQRDSNENKPEQPDPNQPELVGGALIIVRNGLQEILTLPTGIARAFLAARDANELSDNSFPFSKINEMYSTYGIPVMRSDLGSGPESRSVILSREEVDLLGCFAFVRSDGQIDAINSEMINGDVLILLPADFGDMDPKIANRELTKLFPNGLGFVE